MRLAGGRGPSRRSAKQVARARGLAGTWGWMAAAGWLLLLRGESGGHAESFWRRTAHGGGALMDVVVVCVGGVGGGDQ